MCIRDRPYSRLWIHLRFTAWESPFTLFLTLVLAICFQSSSNVSVIPTLRRIVAQQYGVIVTHVSRTREEEGVCKTFARIHTLRPPYSPPRPPRTTWGESEAIDGSKGGAVEVGQVEPLHHIAQQYHTHYNLSLIHI